MTKGDAAMTLQGFLTLAVLFLLLGAGAMFIAVHDGWKGGCAGNCARCHQPCADPEATLAKKHKNNKDGEHK